MNTPSIRQAGLTVVIFTIATKFIGFFREVVVAGYYGTSQVVDIYLAGITIPLLIRTVLGQALPNAFIPLFTRENTHGGGSKRTAFFLLIILGVVAAILWIAAKPLALLTSGGFSGNAQREVMVIFRIATGAIVLTAVESIFRSRLLARKRFVYTSLAGLWLSSSMIAAVILYPGGGARTLVWGFLSGSMITVIWYLIPCLRHRPTAESPPPAQSRQFGSEGRWVTAVLFLGSIGALYTFVDRHLASFLGEGSIAAIQYANLLVSQPVAICGIAIGLAAFPYLSSKVAEGDTSAITRILDRAFRWTLIGSIPIAVWLGVFGDEIVSVLFERGAFDIVSRESTGALLIPYSIWLVPVALTSVLLRVYYASFRWRPILLAALTGLAVKTSLSFMLVNNYDAAGLVAASAAAAISTLAVLFIALSPGYRRGTWSGWLRLAIFLTGVSFIGAFAGISLVEVFSISSWGARAVSRVAAGVILSFGLGILLGRPLRIAEVSRVYNWFSRRRLRR